VQNIDDVLQGFVVRNPFDNVLNYREFEIFQEYLDRRSCLDAFHTFLIADRGTHPVAGL